MATTPDNALTPSPSSDGRAATPLWIWLIMLALAALAVYGGYRALSNYQLYYDTNTARQAVVREKDRLQADVTDLRQQVEKADKARTEAENALTQSRADTKTASDQISDLQGKLAASQDKIKSMEGAVTAAEAKAKQAADAKTALEKEVEGLKSKLNDIQSKLDQTLSDLTKAQKQSQSQTAEPTQPAAP